VTTVLQQLVELLAVEDAWGGNVGKILKWLTNIKLKLFVGKMVDLIIFVLEYNSLSFECACLNPYSHQVFQAATGDEFPQAKPSQAPPISARRWLLPPRIFFSDFSFDEFYML
jgi:hypothetical protein